MIPPVDAAKNAQSSEHDTDALLSFTTILQVSFKMKSRMITFVLRPAPLAVMVCDEWHQATHNQELRESHHDRLDQPP